MKIRFGICMLLAIAFAMLALCPQLDARADRFFSWHMAQHMVLLFLVPLFVLLAQPFRMFASVCSKGTTAAFVRTTRSLHVIANPVIAMAIFVGTLWLTHFSAIYNFALDHEWAHVLEHAWYLFAGFMFWTPVLAPPPVRPLPFPARIAYLLFALPQGALLAFAIGGSTRVLYAHYAWNTFARTDQGNAAAVMWVAGGLIVFTAFLSTFGVWAFRESAAHRDQVPGGVS